MFNLFNKNVIVLGIAVFSMSHSFAATATCKGGTTTTANHQRCITGVIDLPAYSQVTVSGLIRESLRGGSTKFGAGTLKLMRDRGWGPLYDPVSQKTDFPAGLAYQQWKSKMHYAVKHYVIVESKSRTADVVIGIGPLEIPIPIISLSAEASIKNGW